MYVGGVTIRVGRVPIDPVNAQLCLFDSGEEIEKPPVAIADRLASRRSLPADHLLLLLCVDRLASVPEEARTGVGRVQRKDLVQLALLDVGREVPVELGIDRVDCALPGRLPGVAARHERREKRDQRDYAESSTY